MTAATQNYGAVAREYYDARVHPTCANFTEASHLLLGAFWEDIARHLQSLGRGADFLDLGCGKSVLAEELIARGQAWRRLVLVDESESMLTYSRGFNGAELVLAESAQLPLGDASIDLTTAFMGDPFNTEATWQELARVLRPGGLVLFTAPSFAWANAFRASGSGERAGSALFVVDGTKEVYLPSHVLARPDQEALMRRAGFAPVSHQGVRPAALKGRLSAKLKAGIDVAEGYLVRRD